MTVLYWEPLVIRGLPIIQLAIAADVSIINGIVDVKACRDAVSPVPGNPSADGNFPPNGSLSPTAT